MPKSAVIIAFLLIASARSGSGQGCSDAGFCSIDVLKNSQFGEEPVRFSTLAFGTGFGAGLESVATLTSYAEFSHTTAHNWSFGTKVTGVMNTGPKGTIWGAGDLYLQTAFQPKPTENSKTSVLLSVKLPLSEPNSTDASGMTLPMEYQSTLGTVDLISGVSINYRKKWEINAGVQLPLSGENSNNYLKSENASEDEGFSSTRKFERSGDVLIRAGYHIELTKAKIHLKPNLLAIYHLKEDRYTAINGEKRSITGSEGFTLNAGFIATYKFRNRHEAEFLAATPLVVRKERPDGLTRSLVLNLQYKIPLNKIKE